MQRTASSSFSCCDGLRASWSVKEPSSSLPAQLPGPALGAGKIGSCLEKQAGGGSEIAAGKRASRAPGCSSSCCSPTGLPGPPRSPAAQPLPVFLPNYGGSGFLPAALPLLCLAQCRLSLRTGLALGTPHLTLSLGAMAGAAGTIGGPRSPLFSVRLPFHAKEGSASQKAFPGLCHKPRGHRTVLHQMQGLKLERGQRRRGGRLGSPSHSKKSFEMCSTHCCTGRVFTGENSFPPAQPGQAPQALLWEGERRAAGTSHGHAQPLRAQHRLTDRFCQKPPVRDCHASIPNDTNEEWRRAVCQPGDTAFFCYLKE